MLNVTSMGNEAFSVCRNLRSIELPKSLISIGNGAFRECHSLTSIGDRAFEECDNLVSVCLPKLTELASENIFANCPKLSSICLAGVIKIGGNHLRKFQI